MDGYITALGACADGGKARSLCSKIRAGCRDEDSRKRALDAGAADALVGALARFRGEAGVQEAGCYALRAASTGFDADALLRKQAAAAAGALEAAVAALRAHPQAAGVQERACR